MDGDTHKREVGWRLGVAIDALNLKQTDVCRELSPLTTQRLNNWLRGDHYPDPWFVYRFCTRYQISSDWLFLGKAVAEDGAVAGALWRAALASPAA